MYASDLMESAAVGGLDDYAEKATIGLLNYHTIKNGFFLGGTEFRDLARPVDWKQLEQLGKVCCLPQLQPLS